MWTVVGIIFSIVLIGFPVVKCILMFIAGAGASATGRARAEKELEVAYAAKVQQDALDRNSIMSQEYRLRKIAAEPTSIVVGEIIKKERGPWKSGWGYTEITKLENPKYYWKQKKEEFSLTSYHETPENGYTKSLYEYISKVEFLDDYSEEEWCKENNVKKREIYLSVREQQCYQYCKAISQLAYRYICFEGYDEFKETFIRVLMQDKELIIKFMKECQAANEWKKEFNQVCDCENYMQDFMKENNIQEKVNEFVGHEVKMPGDFRVYRKDSPDFFAAKHVNHELEKRGWDISAADSGVKSSFWWGAVFVSTIISLIVLWSCISSPVNDDNIGLRRFLLVICFFVWTFFMVMAAGHTSNVERIQKAKVDEQDYSDGHPNEANLDGYFYAKKLTQKIMQHPLPYKYYSKGAKEDGEQNTTGDQGQDGTVSDGLHS